MADSTPVLWQMPVSIFSEKGRWALDYKGIAHRRRNVVPGVHGVTLRLRGLGTTVPALASGRRRIAGSSAIVAAAECLRPTPPLYPADAAERVEALRLEAYFDDCGHDVRRVALGRMLDDPEGISELLRPPGPRLPIPAPARPMARRITRRRYGVDKAQVERADARVAEAFDEIERRAGRTGYLVGDAFSVADLTAAALLGHLLGPPEYPYPMWASAPARRLREALSEGPGPEWVLEMYRRHRTRSAEVE
jgi:glutathione S-transferase